MLNVLEAMFYVGQGIPAFIIYRLSKLKKLTFVNKMIIFSFFCEFFGGLGVIFFHFKLLKER